MLNLLVGLLVLLALGFVVWVGWTYYRNGRLKRVSGVISLIAMVASLPLGTRLVMERARVFARASSDPVVVTSQFEKANNKSVVYVTLSDPAFVYLEFVTADGKEMVLSEGRIEPRIAHAFTLEKPERFTSKEGKIFVNGAEDAQVVVVE